MWNSPAVTYLSKIKKIWIDKMNELNSEKIIQKDLEESIKWRRRYWEIYSKNIEIGQMHEKWHFPQCTYFLLNLCENPLKIYASPQW